MYTPDAEVPHEIEIVIDLSGDFEATVLGITGTACSDISAFLDQLGEVTEDRKLPPYYQTHKQIITTRK